MLFYNYWRLLWLTRLTKKEVSEELKSVPLDELFEIIKRLLAIKNPENNILLMNLILKELDRRNLLSIKKSTVNQKLIEQTSPSFMDFRLILFSINIYI